MLDYFVVPQHILHKVTSHRVFAATPLATHRLVDIEVLAGDRPSYSALWQPASLSEAMFKVTQVEVPAPAEVLPWDDCLLAVAPCLEAKDLAHLRGRATACGYRMHR